MWHSKLKIQKLSKSSIRRLENTPTNSNMLCVWSTYETETTMKTEPHPDVRMNGSKNQIVRLQTDERMMSWKSCDFFCNMTLGSCVSGSMLELTRGKYEGGKWSREETWEEETTQMRDGNRMNHCCQMKTLHHTKAFLNRFQGSFPCCQWILTRKQQNKTSLTKRFYPTAATWKHQRSRAETRRWTGLKLWAVFKSVHIIHCALPKKLYICLHWN